MLAQQTQTAYSHLNIEVVIPLLQEMDEVQLSYILEDIKWQSENSELTAS